MHNTAHLALPFIMPAQAQKHVTHNEALDILDAAIHIAVPTRTGMVEPALSATEGERHLVPASAGGVWSGRAGDIAVFSAGGWSFLTPTAGWTLFVEDEGALLVHDGTDFRPVAAPLPRHVAQWGVGAEPDTVNRLSVVSPASLFSHTGNDHRMAVNKAAPDDTASLLFQTGFSGRAEFGLAGSDSFSVKVSADGTQWREAMRADPATGTLRAPNGLALSGQTPLRHYEEGFFTPSLRGATVPGDPTYIRAEGSFVRIGSLVMAWGHLIWSAKGGIEGALSVHGLPLPNRPGPMHRAAIDVAWYDRFTMGTSVTMLGGFVEPGTNHIRLWGATNPGTGINRLIAHDAIGDDGEVYFNCSYLTSA